MNAKKIVNPVLMWLSVLFGIFILFVNIPMRNVFMAGKISEFLVFPAILYWMYFLGGALVVNWQVARSADRVEEIITDGVYGFVRHPIYSADIVLAIGIFLRWPNLRVLIGVLWVIIVLTSWAKMEEVVLESKFREEYGQYKKTVPMFFPRLWKRKK